MIDIRTFEPGDWPALWRLLEPVFRAGETYAFARDIDEAEAHARWVEAPTETWIAFDASRELVATYYIKPNQPGPGDHVCNCGYIVAEAARGRGIAGTLCEHSLDAGRRLGFRAMQYNLVVATNEGGEDCDQVVVCYIDALDLGFGFSHHCIPL